MKFKIDLVNNKKEAILVNGLAMAVLLVMLIPVYRVFYELGADAAREGFREAVLPRLPKLLLTVVCFLLYIPGHEAVHGMVMRCFTNEKLQFGYRFTYAYAGSVEAVFNPVEYSLVALAPVVCFHLVFDLLLELVPSYRLVWLFLMAMNVSGAMGDFYVFFRIAPKWRGKLLIQDTGTDMTVYEENEKN